MSEDRLIDLYFEPEDKWEVDEKYPGLDGLIQSGEWALYLFLSSIIKGDKDFLGEYGIKNPDIIPEDVFPFLDLMLKGEVYEANKLGGGGMTTTTKEVWAKLSGICKSLSDLFEVASKGYYHFSGDAKD
jgi:hypothetical protein